MHRQKSEHPRPLRPLMRYVAFPLILALMLTPAAMAQGQISDTQVSLLAGIAFTIFYTLMGVPIARLADQKNRRTIIAVGIASWSNRCGSGTTCRASGPTTSSIERPT